MLCAGTTGKCNTVSVIKARTNLLLTKWKVRGADKDFASDPLLLLEKTFEIREAKGLAGPRVLDMPNVLSK